MRKTPKGVLVSESRGAPLTEASLSRLRQHWLDSGFAIVSVFRGEKSHRENMAMHKRLKSAVRSDGYGFIPLTGYWFETHAETGEQSRQEEISLLVPAMGDVDELRRDALDWGRLSSPPQESIILAEPGGPVRFLDPVTGKEQFKLSKFRPGAVGDIYSKLNKRPGTFMFEGWRWTKPPTSQVEATRRKHEGEVAFISET